MRKTIASVVTALLVGGGLALVTAAPASATEEIADNTEVCVPAEAWTETIEHEAIGEPTIVVDNPDYVAPTYTPGWTEHIPASYVPPVGTPTITVEQDNPDYVAAVPESSYIVHHEAETKIVHHEAVTKFHEEVSHTEWKYTKNGGHGFVWLDNNDEHKVKIDGHWYQRTSHTRVVVDQEAYTETISEAWDETVVTKEAWDETVVIPGTPAQGDPTIWVTIENPDYVAPVYTPAHEVEHPAVYTPPVGKPTMVIDNPEYVAPRTEVIEHAAVECPVVPEEPEEPEEPTTPTTPEEPKDAVTPIAKTAAVVATASDVSDEETLAQTGAEAIVPLTAGSLAVALLSLGGLLFAKRRRDLNVEA